MFKKTNCLNCQGGGSYSSPMQKSIWDFGGRMLVCKNGKIKSEDDLLLACPKKKGKKWQQYILSFWKLPFERFLSYAVQIFGGQE